MCTLEMVAFKLNPSESEIRISWRVSYLKAAFWFVSE
jgi:hypothetical protein